MGTPSDTCIRINRLYGGHSSKSTIMEDFERNEEFHSEAEKILSIASGDASEQVSKAVSV